MSDTATELAALRAEVERMTKCVLDLAEGTANLAKMCMSLSKTTAANSVVLEQIAEKLDDLTIDSLMKAGGHKSLEERIQDAVEEVVRRRRMN